MLAKFAPALATAAVLAACATSPGLRPTPRYAYESTSPVTLNVADIQVVEAYTSPGRAPNVEHQMPDPLPRAVANWARNHFKAAGSEGTAVITVKQAGVVKKDLPLTRGVTGLLTEDQAEQYDATIQVEFAVDGAPMGRSGSGSVNLHRSQTVSEKASVGERDALWTQLAEKMIGDLNANTKTMMQQRLPFLAQP